VCGLELLDTPELDFMLHFQHSGEQPSENVPPLLQHRPAEIGLRRVGKLLAALSLFTRILRMLSRSLHLLSKPRNLVLASTSALAVTFIATSSSRPLHSSSSAMANKGDFPVQLSDNEWRAKLSPEQFRVRPSFPHSLARRLRSKLMSPFLARRSSASRAPSAQAPASTTSTTPTRSVVDRPSRAAKSGRRTSTILARRQAEWGRQSMHTQL